MSAKANNVNDVRISITPSPDAHKGPKALQQALGLVITDKASQASVHEAANQWKRERKDIETYYRTGANGTGIVKPLYDAYKAALAMMEAHIAPYDEAIKLADRVEVEYVQERKRIEAAEAETARLKAEAIELARRQKEADKAEAAALKLEASSNVLSEREQNLVSLLVTCALRNGSGIMPGLTQWVDSVVRVGYKNVTATVDRLMQSEKIITAINAQFKAVAIRRESEAKQAAPVLVDVVTKPSEIVDGGIRTYYGCKDITDYPALLRKIVAQYEGGNLQLQADVDRYLVPALMTLMGAQARSLKDLFPQVWPMCQLDKRDGTVGR